MQRDARTTNRVLNPKIGITPITTAVLDESQAVEIQGSITGDDNSTNFYQVLASPTATEIIRSSTDKTELQPGDELVELGFDTRNKGRFLHETQIADTGRNHCMFPADLEEANIDDHAETEKYLRRMTQGSCARIIFALTPSAETQKRLKVLGDKGWHIIRYDLLSLYPSDLANTWWARFKNYAGWGAQHFFASQTAIAAYAATIGSALPWLAVPSAVGAYWGTAKGFGTGFRAYQFSNNQETYFYALQKQSESHDRALISTKEKIESCLIEISKLRDNHDVIKPQLNSLGNTVLDTQDTLENLSEKVKVMAHQTHLTSHALFSPSESQEFKSRSTASIEHSVSTGSPKNGAK